MVPTTLDEWFAVSHHIVYDKKREGARLNKERQLVLGWCAGTSTPELANLAHEMGHMVEIPHNRIWWQRDWGLTANQVRIVGDYYDQPKSDTGVTREIKTIAIQWHIMRHLGLDPHEVDYEVGNFCKSLVYVYDYLIFCYKHGVRLERFEYKQLDAAAQEVIRTKLERLKARTNIERIWREWCAKCEVLDNVL